MAKCVASDAWSLNDLWVGTSPRLEGQPCERTDRSNTLGPRAVYRVSVAECRNPGMKIRVAPLGAFFSVLSFLAWITLGTPEVPSESEAAAPFAATEAEPIEEQPELQDRTAGSIVPCAVPLAWHIARVDEAFGVEREEVRAAVAEAATTWEEASGANLFSNESAGDLPVRLVYDNRQENRQHKLALDAAGDSLDSRRARLDGEHDRNQAALRELDRRITTLNDTIRAWNERGGAPAVVQQRLATAGRLLDAEREALTEHEREGDRLRLQLEDEFARLAREMEAHERETESLRESSPARPVESGVYREAVHVQDGRVASTSREIRIYQFDGPEDLVFVAAHELGHALGLGHDTLPESIMSEEFNETDLLKGAITVQPRDVEVLRSLCPNL